MLESLTSLGAGRFGRLFCGTGTCFVALPLTRPSDPLSRERKAWVGRPIIDKGMTKFCRLYLYKCISVLLYCEDGASDLIRIF